MLRSLRVTNFLLVEDARLAPADGFSVLSGETGTGKSILLRALALLLGARGTAAWVRRGASKLRVEAEFADKGRTRPLVARLGVAARDGEVVVAREIDRHGRSRCFINDQRVLVAALRRLGPALVEVHGQREEERFRRVGAQRDLLDLFGGHADLRRTVRDAFGRAKRAQQALEEHRARIAKLSAEEDWLRFQAEEIESLAPQTDEIETLRERVRSLSLQSEKSACTDLAERLLNGREGAVLESLESLDHALARLSPEEPGWNEFREGAADLRVRARSLYRMLAGLRNDASESGEELARAEVRLASLVQLERKHRRPLAEILSLAEELRESLTTLERAREREAELRNGRELARKDLRAAAARLTAARAQAATRFARRMNREISALGLGDCKLRVVIQPNEKSTGRQGAAIGPNGAERVAFEIETNPGEGFRPLGVIASGGEMSRIALGIRVAVGGAGACKLTVFDEIDAGLGGQAAKEVAARLAAVARHRPVLLVTHLPTIAAAAARQFRVSKEKKAGRNVVRVVEVAGAERVAEIARMLSGDGRDARAQEHARVLLGSEF